MTGPEDTRAFLRTLAAARSKAREGAWDHAARLWERVVAHNPVEANFWASLANARYRAGDYREAIPAFEKAIELGTGDGTDLGPALSPFPFDAAYRIACCYALLNEQERALEWLATAFGMGYRRLDVVQKDDDLASLRDDARFREIVGMTDPSAMSREEGWRFDLTLLSRHIKRKAYDPFRHMTEQDLDRTVEEVSRAIPRLTDAQITVEMMKLLCRLGDGHAGIEIPEERAELGQAVPVQLFLFEEGLFVIAAPPRHEDLLGAQIVRFGDQTVEAVVQGLLPILSRDNEHWPKATAPHTIRLLPILHALGLIRSPDEVSLTVVDLHGETRSVSLAAEENPTCWSTRLCPEGWISLPDTLGTPLPLYLKNLATAYWFEYLPESRTVYFQFNSVRDESGEELRDFTDRLFRFVDETEVDRLVIDVRWNGGGNTFLEMPLLHRLIGGRKINRRGSLWVVIGRHTFSAAQNFVTLLNRHTEALFVGEPTGSRPNFVGETIPICLPYSRLRANVSDLYWQTSWPVDYRTWIAPLLHAPPTCEALRQNRDPALEAVLACTEQLPGW